MYDLVKKEDEDREQCLQRHWQHYSRWSFSKVALNNIENHVFKQDYAESYQSLEKMAKASGFVKVERLFIDKHSLFSVYCFYN